MLASSFLSCASRDTPIPTVELSKRAAREIARARRWWLANREKAPAALDEELAALVEKLEANPSIVGVRQRGGSRRRVLLKRIRYYVYFRVSEDEARVQILAFWHASRGREPKVR